MSTQLPERLNCIMLETSDLNFNREELSQCHRDEGTRKTKKN